MKPSNLAVSVIALVVSSALTALFVSWDAPYLKKERLLFFKESEISTSIVDKLKASPEDEAFLKERKFVLLKQRARDLIARDKSEEGKKVLEWIRQRDENDTQLDQNLAMLEIARGKPEKAKKYYEHIIEKSTNIAEVSEAINYLSSLKPQSYVKGVREFIVNYNKEDRFKALIDKAKRWSMDDTTWILLIGLETVEGRESQLKADSVRFDQFIRSFHLQNYVYTSGNGSVSLDFKRLRNDLVDENNPKRKPIAPENTVKQAMIEVTTPGRAF